MSATSAGSTGNPDYARAVHELRRSSAASRHTDRHAEQKKGHHARGGRAGAKQDLRASARYSKEY